MRPAGAVPVIALERASVDEVGIISAGVHLVPGAILQISLAHGAFQVGATAVPLVIAVDDEERHRSHLLSRSDATSGRPPTRYLDDAAFELVRDAITHPSADARK